MKYLKEHWKSRTLWILGISLVVTALLWALSLTDWADAMNQIGGRGRGMGEHGGLGEHAAMGERGGRGRPGGDQGVASYLMGLVSILKVIVLTVVPAVIWYWLSRLVEIVKGKKQLSTKGL